MELLSSGVSTLDVEVIPIVVCLICAIDDHEKCVAEHYRCVYYRWWSNYDYRWMLMAISPVVSSTLVVFHEGCILRCTFLLSNEALSGVRCDITGELHYYSVRLPIRDAVMVITTDTVSKSNYKVQFMRRCPGIPRRHDL